MNRLAVLREPSENIGNFVLFTKVHSSVSPRKPLVFDSVAIE